MNSLTVLFIGLGALLVVVILLVSRARSRARPRGPLENDPLWDNAAVQKFFIEVAADEKLFGIDREDNAITQARKAEQLREIEALLASSDYKALTEEQQEMRVKLLADDSVVRLVEESKSVSKENERLIFDLRARRQQEANAFVDAQQKRDADIARLREMERRAQASGYVNKELLAEIEGLKRRMAMSRYMGNKKDD